MRTISLRRSSFNAGIGTRITPPSVAGFNPSSALRIAFSTTATRPLSHGCTISIRGSGALTVATWFNGIFDPYASTRTRSRSAGDALPVRTPENSRRIASSAFSICARASLAAMTPSNSLESLKIGKIRDRLPPDQHGRPARSRDVTGATSRRARRRVSGNQRAHLLAAQRGGDGTALVDVEHDDR